MTRQALAEDRGLQPERTALAWTRTSLAAVVSGGLVLLKDREVVNLPDHPARVVVAGVVACVAVALFLLGIRRRRMLTVRSTAAHNTARREVFGAAGAVLALTTLVVAYMVLSSL